MSNKGRDVLKTVLIILLANMGSSLFIKIEKGNEKCLYEEVFYDSTIVVVYEVLNNFSFINSQPSDVKLQFFIKNEDSNDTIFTFDELLSKGKFSFHVSDSRNILICLTSSYKPWFTSGNDLDVKILFHTNFDEVDQNAATNKEFETLNVELTKSKGELNKISAMQRAEKSQEEKFTEYQQSTSSSILYISIIQILLVLVLGILQIKLVKRLFNII